MAKPAATAVPACAMAGFDELAGRAGVLPVKTVGDELDAAVGAEGAEEVGAGVGAVDPGTYVEIEVAAGDEVAVVAGAGAGAGVGVGVGAGDAIDTGAELATMTGVGVAMTGGGGGVGVAMTGGGGGATGKTGSEAEVVVVTDAVVAMID